MPPKIMFSKEEIEDAAFKLFSQGGIQNVSVRKIAALLGSSTAPIYTSFGNMDEIRDILMDKALKLLLTYTAKTYTFNTFLNIGVGILIFARENKMLYRTLFMENNQYQSVFDRFYEQNLIRMRQEKILSMFVEQDLRAMLTKMTIFTLGIAAQLCAGMLKDTSDDWFITTLLDVGDDVIGATAFRSGKIDEYIKLGGECKE